MTTVKLYCEEYSDSQTKDFVEVTQEYIDICKQMYDDTINDSYPDHSAHPLYKRWDALTTELAITNFGYFKANESGFAVQFAVWDYFEQGDCCLVD